ncbi:MAG: DMT family transporter [Burkholderiaceae bacterium]
METALMFAASSSLCFGIALVTSRIGLRTLDARTGAAISVPTATLVYALCAPFAFDAQGFNLRAALLFAGVGLFFPALVTILTFRSNEQLGPTLTGAVSGTAALFALLFAGLLLGERVPAQAALACVAVVAGVAVMAWKQDAVRPGFVVRSLLWPLGGALLRGLAQAGAKAGLLLWPSPFAAGLIGYLVSSATLVAGNRVGRSSRPNWHGPGISWFALTGALNGAAVLLMYGALSLAPVTFVAPIVATYPLIAALASAVLLRDEPLTAGMWTGAAVTVLAIVYLVASKPGV